MTSGNVNSSAATALSPNSPPSYPTVHMITLGGVGFALIRLPNCGPFHADLTESERNVVELMLRGLTNAEIARARATSARTVANQLQTAFRKLRVTSRAEAAARITSGIGG